MNRNIAALVVVFAVAWAMMPGHASSHREAPLTAHGPHGGQHRRVRLAQCG